MNILFCSVGRRAKLLQNVKKTLGQDVKIVATDAGKIAPALYFADKTYIVPKITDSNYIPEILAICKKEEIQVITTLIDPEIEILAKNREIFEKNNILVLAPYEQTAELCFDKFKMYEYLVKNGINTVKTYGDFQSFKKAYEMNAIEFPVFVKPRTGSGSVGARKVDDIHVLEEIMRKDNSLIVQEFMDGQDLDADVYIDAISRKPVAIFTKRKLSTTIGGANKTVSFKDDKLFSYINDIIEKLDFCGPIDMDFFYKNGTYYLSEINPRFGGAYLHAYGAGVDFIQLIYNNYQGKMNLPQIGNYEENIMMMMYDDVVITKIEGI